MGLEIEYQALGDGPALVDRSYRALLEVEGRDRAAWLHNLTTNQVKNLGQGDGNYAFVLNVQGRILFDVNLLVRADSIWLDLDRCFLDTAKKHFAKYIITEDVAVVDRTDEFARFGLVGRQASTVLADLGAANAAAMPALGQAIFEWSNPSRERERPDNQYRDSHGAVQVAAAVTMGLLRHDFCGPFSVELFVPRDRAAEFRAALIEKHRAIPVSNEAVQVRRIEAGIPWPGHEITDDYLPAETRQLERAVSYQKGCYLGQEVVERMRSRAVVARQLVGLRLDTSPRPVGSDEPTKEGGSEGRAEGRPQLLDSDGKPVGTVTSACNSIALNSPIALAYVKTALSAPATALTVEGVSAKIVDLPFQR